jgi:hypothetical protein
MIAARKSISVLVLFFTLSMTWLGCDRELPNGPPIDFHLEDLLRTIGKQQGAEVSGHLKADRNSAWKVIGVTYKWHVTFVSGTSSELLTNYRDAIRKLLEARGLKVDVAQLQASDLASEHGGLEIKYDYSEESNIVRLFWGNAASNGIDMLVVCSVPGRHAKTIKSM